MEFIGDAMMTYEADQGIGALFNQEIFQKKPRCPKGK